MRWWLLHQFAGKASSTKGKKGKQITFLAELGSHRQSSSWRGRKL